MAAKEYPKFEAHFAPFSAEMKRMFLQYKSWYSSCMFCLSVSAEFPNPDNPLKALDAVQ